MAVITSYSIHYTKLYEFQAFAPTDPMFGGVGDQPPELADQVDAARVALWLRLRCPEFV